MPRATAGSHRLRPDLLAAGGMYLLLVSLFALAFTTARTAGDWSLVLHMRVMRVIVAAAAAGIWLSVPLLVAAYFRARDDRRGDFWLPATMSLAAGALTFALAEAVMRVLAQPHALGTSIGRTVLLPYEWRAVARGNLELLEPFHAGKTLFRPDPVLGWTIAPNRVSGNGLYKSSMEGLRSREAGERHAGTGEREIALFGNSFAFSEEVPYEASLAHHAEQRLGPGTRVLNFGVPAYGVDQTLLRFREEGLDRTPQLAIFSFIEEDLRRTVNVYPFMKVRWQLPLSKPRFVMREGEMTLLNSPTLAPEDIFAKPSVFDLPLLDQEVEFAPHYWRSHALHGSYFLRYLVTLFPMWPAANAATSESVMATLGARIIEEFVATARQAGIPELIVYLPTAADFRAEGPGTLKGRVLESLAAQGIVVNDFTRCIADRIPGGVRFHPGGHYTDEGNAAAAECLTPLVEARLSGAAPAWP